MTLNDLTSFQLNQLLGLLKEKEFLADKISRINETIDKLVSGDSARFSSPSKKAKSRQKRKGAPLKARIILALKESGPSGLTVGDIAQKLDAKKASISVWLYTTGKKTGEIKKVGRGRFVVRR